MKAIENSGRVTSVGKRDMLVLHPVEIIGSGGRRRNPDYPEINIRETARTMGVHESHLSHLLNCSVQPTLPMAKRLADLFEISIEEVVRTYEHNRRKNNQHGNKRKRFRIPESARARSTRSRDAA